MIRGGRDNWAVHRPAASRRLGRVMLMALLAGCTPSAPEPDEAEPAAQPIVKTADRGAVRLTVTAARDRISIAERVALTVEVEADAGIEVKMPEFGANLNQFEIRDFRVLPVEEMGDGRRRYAQVYDLDIFLSGQYEVPAITAQYRVKSDDPKGDAKDAAEAGAAGAEQSAAAMAELTTEPFNIEVTSLLEGEFDPSAFRDVKGVMDLPRDPTWVWLWWIGGGVGAVLVVVGAVLIARRWHRRGRRVITIPPHEWAFAQLAALAAARLVEAGQVREFHYRLSEIARTYIELRFALMAPERTTEEFLREMRSSGVLPAAHQPRLAAFLEACDMVKYARYEPDTEEIEHVFNVARDFIAQTRQVAAADAEQLEEVAA